MKYNDGFIAYLNGTEIARRNAVSTNWNATAASPRTDGASSVFEEINITPIPASVAGRDKRSCRFTARTSTQPTTPSSCCRSSSARAPSLSSGISSTRRPATANQGGVVGFVGDTGFSHTRGFYTTPFSLTITTPTPGAVIRYTVDGSDPTETTASSTQGPIDINGTTILRAAAFKTGFRAFEHRHTNVFLSRRHSSPKASQPPPGWPANGQVNGHQINYGMDPNIVNSPTWGPQMMAAMTALPSISLVTPLANLFNPSVRHLCESVGRRRFVGSTDERRADQSEWDARISDRRRIAYSRRIQPQHEQSQARLPAVLPGRVRRRAEFSACLGRRALTSSSKIDLRTGQNYSWSFQSDGSNVMVEEVWNRDTSRDMGQGYTRSRWYHLYLNGHYWGLYQTEERAEASYASSYNGGEERGVRRRSSIGPGSHLRYRRDDGCLDAALQSLEYDADGGRRYARHAIYMQIQGKNPNGTRNSATPFCSM